MQAFISKTDSVYKGENLETSLIFFKRPPVFLLLPGFADKYAIV